MDVSRLSTGEKVAGISGLLLLIIMFAFDWFTVDVGGGFADISVGGNAWDTMELIRFVLFLAAIAGIALAVVAASESRPDLPVALSAVTAGLGILCVLLVLYRIIDPPGGDAEEFGVDVGRGIGVFLGLAASIGVAYGGWRTMQEEGTSFGDAAGGGPDRGAAPPPPPPPPPPSSQPPAGGGPAA